MRLLPIIVVSTLLFAGVLFSLAATPARADTYGLGDAAAQAGLKNKTVFGYSTVPGIVGGFIKIALSFLGIVFFLLVLYAGFLWMTSMGSSEKVEQAKSIIEGAAIGLILVLASYAIATFVFTALDKGPEAVISQGQPATSTR